MKMKGNKLLKIIICICLLFIICYRLMKNILLSFDIAFRPWIGDFILIAESILIITVIILLIKKLIFKHSWANTLKGLLGVALIIGIIIFTMLIFAFSHQPEHVVYRNDKKMVAAVDSYMDVYVYYYPYKNWFIMGKEAKMREWYGNGGYDPFNISNGDKKPVPIKVDYYDK